MLSACGCNWAGSETNICDKTGKCQCRANFQGEKCDKCKEGFAGDYCEKCDSKHQNSPYENGVCLRKIYILFHLINLVTTFVLFQLVLLAIGMGPVIVMTKVNVSVRRM